MSQHVSLLLYRAEAHSTVRTSPVLSVHSSVDGHWGVPTSRRLWIMALLRTRIHKHLKSLFSSILKVCLGEELPGYVVRKVSILLQIFTFLAKACPRLPDRSRRATCPTGLAAGAQSWVKVCLSYGKWLVPSALARIEKSKPSETQSEGEGRWTPST